MKPTRLVMSAFGSYGERTEIDFSLLDGLYIITGDTGAGKTTIFDAITFALYGDVSGTVKEVSMLRSDFAGEDTKTYVELEFVYRDKVYKIERSPAYKRPGKTSVLPANAAMTMSDGKVVTGAKAVTAEVVDLLGIDKNQFTRIAMIAQGDFQKLLLADTEERGKIFRKIFGTEVYVRFQDLLKNKSLELKESRTLSERTIMQYVSSTVDMEIPEGIYGVEAFLKELDKRIKADTSLDKKLQTKEQKLKQELDAVAHKLTIAESRYKSLNITAGDEDVSEQKIKDIENTIEDEDAYRRISEDLTRVNAVIDEYNQLNKSEIEYKSKQDKLKEQEKIIEAYSKERVGLLSDIEAKETSVKELSVIELEEERGQNALKELNLKSEEVSNIIKDISEYKIEQNDLIKKQHEYIEAEKIFKKAEKEASTAEEMFLREQAGIMAAALMDNEPCPVCGSTTHPMPAMLAPNAPSEAQVKKYKKSAQAAQKDKNTKAQAAAELNKAVQLHFDSIKSAAKKQGIEGSDIEDIENILNEKNDNITKEKNNQKQILDKLNKNKKIRDNTTKLISELNNTLTRLDEKILTAKTKLHEIQTDIKSSESRIEEMKRHLDYENLNQAQSEIQSMAQRLSKIKNGMDKLINEYKLVQKDLQNQIDNMATEIKTLYSKIETNKRLLSLIKKELKNYKNIEKEYTDTDIIYRTASGDLSGKSKLAFEQYIQGAYFERIIIEANKRFDKMSGGRYELVRRTEALDKRTKTGLELDVFDNYTGKKRSVKSLSGGESFKASLALALGMSDVIQASAGGVRLDSMFVDEGFGALDDESLGQAIEVLSKLSDGTRNVGIISHVSELKEMIDKKLIVKRGTKGSSVQVII